jgi:hypothetical protein
MYVHFNGNPCGMNIGDCVIRAISIVTGQNRHRVYAGLCVFGYPCTIWGNSNAVWADYLQYLGFKKFADHENQTVGEFAEHHKSGRYIIGTGSHAVACVDGDIIDSWYSLDEIVKYYFAKER